MRRIRLNRHDREKERSQQITLTAEELRARLDQSYEEGKVAGQMNSANVIADLIQARTEERVLKEQFERRYNSLHISYENMVRRHNTDTNTLNDKIRELELAGPLTMLSNKVNRNANRKIKTNKADGARRAGNRRYTRTR